MNTMLHDKVTQVAHQTECDSKNHLDPGEYQFFCLWDLGVEILTL